MKVRAVPLRGLSHMFVAALATTIAGCAGRSLVMSPELEGEKPDAGPVTTPSSDARDASVEDAVPDAAASIDAHDAAPDADDEDARPVVARPAFAPHFPVGYDAYRAWDRWPILRLGTRTYMRSTYDRSGGNEAADASHFLRREADGTFTSLDVEGAGVLSFVRTNHWHGSPWHYGVDGRDTVVTESSTADPDHPVAGSTFMPEAAFPSPLALTWSTTQGADLSWVPIPFESSMRLRYERTHYGTGYYIYQLFADGAVRMPPASWTEDARPPADVLARFEHAGEDPMEDQTPEGIGVVPDTGTVDLPSTPGAAVTIVDLARGPAAVRALRFDVAAADAVAFGRARLRITWDDRAAPSVDVPVSLFFGAGTLYNRSGREWLVKAMPVSIRFADGRATLSAYFPMPFRRHARVELVSTGEAVTGVSWSVRATPWRAPANHAGYLHATYRDHGMPVHGEDLVLLDTNGVEGGGPWCGHLIGTSFVFSDRAALGTLEGDPRFFFDDSQTPQAQGTGTEEWGGGGDYWGGTTMTLPLAGHPTGASDPGSMREPEDGVESAYRFLVADPFPFGRRARVQLEHGGTDESDEHYRTVAFWYGLPGACLSPTDSLHVGDAADEKAHAYSSPMASSVETITSRYEWGVDHADGREIYPATRDFGRHTTGPSELTLAIDPDNLGVMLRRKLDYAIADQRAEVWIADARGGAFERAGIWFLAGSNRCVFAYSRDEMGVGDPRVETSNRRFRDDEFLVPARLTRGRARLRVRVVPAPRASTLAADAANGPSGGHGAADPSGPPNAMHAAPSDSSGAPAGSWSELRYDAYVWKLPPSP
ncbi:MAG TPA: DUF2961 domain-containing protein [Polyangia bacterium]|nr:DUF2961 domain-containing protein [Polyangia bacterium]